MFISKTKLKVIQTTIILHSHCNKSQNRIQLLKYNLSITIFY